MPYRSSTVSILLGLAGALLVALSAAASEVRTVTRPGSFDDARFELNNAIVDKGLKIDYHGKLGDMLDRTGADVGSTKPIYKAAEFFTFCSAKLSRTMMEADAAHIAFCPFVIFLYERADKAGEVVIGYRRPVAAGGSAATGKALAEIDALLADIIKAAGK